MKAVGYFRESGMPGQTLAQQNKAFLDYCEAERHEVACTFAEAAELAGAPLGFRQLVRYLRGHRAADVIVVVTDIAALGADVRDAALHYFQLESLGAQVAPLSGAQDPLPALLTEWTQDDGSGRLSDRVRAAMRKKAVRGEVLGRPPYGYKVGNRRRLELIPEEAVVVRYIFRLYIHEALGIRLIARRLNQEGLKTRRGGNWSMVSIRDILRNRAYLGTYSRFGVRVPGSHPSLVSNDDFQIVQDRLNARRTSYAPRVASQFLLSGLAHCGYCDNKLIGVSRKQAWKRASGEQVSNSYRYYQCESRTNQSVCGYHTQRAADLEAHVREALAECFAAGGGFPQPNEDAVVLADQRRDVERLRSRLRGIDRRIKGYVDAASKGRLAKEKMHALSITAAADHLVSEDALEAAEQRIAEQLTSGERGIERERAVRRLLSAWDELPFVERQSSLRAAVERITVFDDAVKLLLRG